LAETNTFQTGDAVLETIQKHLEILYQIWGVDIGQSFDEIMLLVYCDIIGDSMKVNSYTMANGYRLSSICCVFWFVALTTTTQDTNNVSIFNWRIDFRYGNQLNQSRQRFVFARCESTAISRFGS
jgi:hypothetical protein